MTNVRTVQQNTSGGGIPAVSSDPTYRVLMIAPTSFFADYGCHVRILEEARILQKMGHEVTLATYHNGNDLPGLDIRRTLPILWRRDYEVGSSRHKIAFDALLALKGLSLLARNQLGFLRRIPGRPAARSYDVIHAHLHEGALLAIVLGRLFRLPVIFDFQGSLTEEMVDHGFLNRHGAYYRPLRHLERWIDRTVPCVLTSSAHARNLLTEQFGCGEEQVKTLPDCVNGDIFRPASEHPAEELAVLRDRLQIPANRKLVVYLGLLAEHQGISHLLSAMQQVVQERPDTHLLLMGFPNENFYRSQTQQLGIVDHVTLTGRVPYHNAPRYLSLGDVAVAPKLSTTEGSGKLLNYMAIGLPTIAFDTPVAREYLGLEGIFAQYDSVPSLAQKLVETLELAAENPERATYIGRRLRRRALTSFGWEMAGKQITEIYQQLVKRQALPSLRHQRWAIDQES